MKCEGCVVVSGVIGVPLGDTEGGGGGEDGGDGAVGTQGIRGIEEGIDGRHDAGAVSGHEEQVGEEFHISGTLLDAHDAFNGVDDAGEEFGREVGPGDDVVDHDG